MKYLILVALLFTVHSSFCQDTVKLKNYSITYKSFPTDDEREVFVQYKVWEENLVQPLQTLVHQVGTYALNLVLESEYYNHSPIIVEDWNFDGHEDIGLLQGRGGGTTGRAHHTIYLYDTLTKQFIYNDQLTEFSSPYGALLVLKDKQLITTYERTEPLKGNSRIYAWKDDKLTLILDDLDGNYDNHHLSIHADQVDISFLYGPDSDPCVYVIKIIHEGQVLLNKKIKCEKLAEELHRIQIEDKD
jgi:hypothetical protein